MAEHTEKIGVRVDSTIKEAYREISSEHHVPMSEVIRDALEKFALIQAEELPEYIRKDLDHSRIMRENKWKIRNMSFKNRVREFLNEQLDKPVPPKPSAVEEDYIENLYKEIDKVCREDRSNEFRTWVESELQRYKTLHPENCGAHNTFSEEEYKEAVETAANHVRSKRTDLALEFCQAVESRGRLPATYTVERMLSDARKEAQGDWKSEWDDCVFPHSGED